MSNVKSFTEFVDNDYASYIKEDKEIKNAIDKAIRQAKKEKKAVKISYKNPESGKNEEGRFLKYLRMGGFTYVGVKPLKGVGPMGALPYYLIDKSKIEVIDNP